MSALAKTPHHDHSYRPPQDIILPIDRIVPSDAVAFVVGDDVWTHARFADAIDRLAAGITARGFKTADRIALHMPNGPEASIAYFACFRLGITAVPLNLRYTGSELARALARIRPHGYIGHVDYSSPIADLPASIIPLDARFIVGEQRRKNERPWSDLVNDDHPPQSFVDRDAPIVLLATSGTTAEPKFVAHSLNTLDHISSRFANLGFAIGQTLGFIMPMMHVSGLTILLATLRLGMVSVFMDGSDPDGLLDCLAEHQCTTFGGPPLVFGMMINCQKEAPRALPSMRLCLTSSDACPPGQQEAFEEAFGIPLLSFWGASEAINSLTCGLQNGAVSRLAPDSEMRLTDAAGAEVAPGETGEMQLRGPNVMLGYWRSPGVIDGKTDGWYRSGDLMRQDAEGNIWFVSRLNDLIVRGGSNISPIEVEEALLHHPSVAEAVVVGVPDSVLGQRVSAYIKLTENQDVAQLGSILGRLSSELAAYKLPDRLITITDVPRNGLGKVDRKLLSARMLSRGLA